MARAIENILQQGDGRPAVVYGDKTTSWRQLSDRSMRIFAALRSVPMDPSACIGVLLPNSPDAVAAFLAVAMSGHAYFPLNTGLKKSEVGTLALQCRIGALIGKPDTLEGLETVCPCIPLDRLAEVPGAAPPGVRNMDPDRPFVCLATSGSTGTPRVVERSARAVDANTDRVAAALGAGPGDRFLSVVPFCHANGFSNGLLMPLASGASLVLMERFLPRLLLEAIERHRPTVVVGSPFVYRSLARVLDGTRRHEGVRAWISSGAALPVALSRKLHESGIDIRQLYGSSEAGTISISAPSCGEPGAVGRPLPGVAVRLRAGGEEPAGSGELEVRSDSLFRSYRGEAAGEAFTPDGWYPMGDLGRIDEGGALVLEGRRDLMINVAGVKVDPLEIQRVIEGMPQVHQCLVLGQADDAGGQAVRALVAADEALRNADILAHCRERLAEYKLPRIIERVDRIPEDMMGKSARRLLED